MKLTKIEFAACKGYLDGVVFWRELGDDYIEIKFIPCFKKYAMNVISQLA